MAIRWSNGWLSRARQRLSGSPIARRVNIAAGLLASGAVLWGLGAHWVGGALLVGAAVVFVVRDTPRVVDRSEDRRAPLRPLPAWTVAIAVALVITVTWAVTAWLLRIAGDDAARQIEAIKTGLATGAGTGAAVSLLLAVRRQWSSEVSTVHATHDAAERRITELYSTAADQLGSAKAPVRLAGMYALERLADVNQDQRQTIVSLLCAYLRMPYEPPEERPPQPAAAVEKAQDHQAGGGAGTDYEQRVQERVVRCAAQRILNAHLVSGGPTFWGPDRDGAGAEIWLDLTGAVLIDFDLGGRVGYCSFDAATFIGNARFTGATFTQGVGFSNARFTSDAVFHQARFEDYSVFDDANFGAGAWFGQVSFLRRVRFVAAKFGSNVSFEKAKFAEGANFSKADARSFANFREVTFASDANFEEITFAGGSDFSKVTFTCGAQFRKAKFVTESHFWRANFVGESKFELAIFEAKEATPDSPAWGSGSAHFNEVTFGSKVSYEGTTFNGNASFEGAAFNGMAFFGKATFNGQANFKNTAFSGEAWFDAVAFTDGSFLGADFGHQAVTFGAPRKWHPGPRFDWDQDLSLKPATVTPNTWPPMLQM